MDVELGGVSRYATVDLNSHEFSYEPFDARAGWETRPTGKHGRAGKPILRNERWTFDPFDPF